MKEQLRHLLVNQEYGAIVELAGRKRRILSFLTALTYDPEPLIGWRAVEAIGLAAARMADDDPEFVRIHLRRLQWLLNDESGGIGWRFPEAMGEIIRNRPEEFAEFVPLVISLFDMAAEDAVRFRPGILWAIGRLGQVMPGAVKAAMPRIIPCLDDPDPQTRGLAVWCLGQLGAASHLSHHDALLRDESLVELYSGGQLARKSVAQLVREALESGPSGNRL
jgi:HEAT repeat protein